MFVLVDHLGQVARMRGGEPFRYSSRALASLGKKALESRRDNVSVFRVREVQP